MKLQKVIRVDVKVETRERIVKSKTSTTKRGVATTTEIVERTVVSAPNAVLECGHWLSPRFTASDVRQAARLRCWKCERVAYLRSMPDLLESNPDLVADIAKFERRP